MTSLCNTSFNLSRTTRNTIVAESVCEQNIALLEFPLIAKNNTARNLENKPVKGTSVYFGTGLVTPKAITQGLPFDFLGMLLTAEWVRRRTGARKIIHEISDTHGWITFPGDKKRISFLANEQREVLTELTEALGIADIYDCVLASEYRDSPIFKDIQNEVDALSSGDVPAYFRYQSAGNLYFARHRGVSCKIGWLVEDNNKRTGLDERAFNDSYDALGLDPLCFVYTWCGWNFDSRRSRVSPYTSILGEKRLMLNGVSPAVSELNHLIDGCDNGKISAKAMAHLEKIVRGYVALFGTGGYPVLSKLNLNGKCDLFPSERFDGPALARMIDSIRLHSFASANKWTGACMSRRIVNNYASSGVSL